MTAMSWAPPMKCPVCGHPTATMLNPMGFLDGRAVLRTCTNPGRPGALWDACAWEQTEDLVEVGP